jgi:hypothetical protein
MLGKLKKRRLLQMLEFIWRHSGTWKFPFSDKDDMSETESGDTVAKLPRPICLGGTARTTTLKYFGVNFSLFEERIMYIQCTFMDITFIWIRLLSIILFLFRNTQWLLKCTLIMGQIFTRCIV